MKLIFELGFGLVLFFCVNKIFVSSTVISFLFYFVRTTTLLSKLSPKKIHANFCENMSHFNCVPIFKYFTHFIHMFCLTQNVADAPVLKRM